MIKDLFRFENSYIVEYRLTDNLYLYLEGLTDNGECITNIDFDEDKIKGLLVELHKYNNNDKESLICQLTLDLTDMLEWVKDYVIEELAQEKEEKK